MPLSTNFRTYEARIVGTEAAPRLKVQMDLEKAQQTESNIHVLVSIDLSPHMSSSLDLQNGFWADVYPFVGISGPFPEFGDRDLEWGPP